MCGAVGGVIGFAIIYGGFSYTLLLTCWSSRTRALQLYQVALISRFGHAHILGQQQRAWVSWKFMYVLATSSYVDHISLL